MHKIDLNMVKKYINDFHQFLKNEGQIWQAERDQKDKFFQEHFSKDKLKDLDEGTLRDLINILWSFNGWTNKDYLLEEMMSTGIEKIREALIILLYSDEDISKRFDYVKDNVRMLGAAGISEILIHHNHFNYPIWNRRSRAGLIAIGIPESSLPNPGQIRGKQYQSFCKLQKENREQISSEYPEFIDLFYLDFFLYFISLKKRIKPIEPGIQIETEDHENFVDLVIQLGVGLGFDAKRSVKITHGCVVDAVWSSRIANLGKIAYAFEVHCKGSRDSAILNLLRVKGDPSIQKVIIVANQKELETFRNEISTLDEEFRNSVGYFPFSDLQNAIIHLEMLIDIVKSLGLFL